MNILNLNQNSFKGNKKHLAVLLESIEHKTSKIWNDWRLGNKEMPDLRGLNLPGVNLGGFDFSATSFDKANLSNSNFTTCDLSGANFYQADMESVEMQHASAYGAQFRYTNLSDAVLLGTVFNSASLKCAVLTGSKIHGIGRTGWDIEGIVCDYVYVDLKCKKRFPEDRIFEEGEFEKLYKSYPLIDLEFHNKFDALTILMVNYASIQLNNEDGKFDFQVKEVSTYGNIPTIKVSVKTKEQIPEATTILKERITELEKQLETKQVDVNKLYGLLSDALNQPTQIQNTFNSEVSIGQLVNGNNYGTQNTLVKDLSNDLYSKLIKELENSNLPQNEKSIGKKLLKSLKDNASSAAQSQVGAWAKSLTTKGLEQIPKLLDFLS